LEVDESHCANIFDSRRLQDQEEKYQE
jgi:hypothetical protein